VDRRVTFANEDRPGVFVPAHLSGNHKEAAVIEQAKPTVRPVLYEVSLLPAEDINFRPFLVHVECLDGQWAVVHGDACLSADGAWSRGVQPYGRGDDWLRVHRFELDVALRLAAEAAPSVVVGGISAAQAVAASRAVPALGRQDAEEVIFGDTRLPARFWTSVREDESGCWLWTLKTDRYGYARYKIGEQRYAAHRFIYEAVVAPIGAGMQLDHVCHSLDSECLGGRTCAHRRCVHPLHLEPVSNRTNSERRASSLLTSCPRGHAYDVANVGRNSKGGRYCRTCRRIETRERRAAASGEQVAS
jgi:hypothetical protein